MDFLESYEVFQDTILGYSLEVNTTPYPYVNETLQIDHFRMNIC